MSEHLQNQRVNQQALSSELATLWTTSQFFATLQKIMLEEETPPDPSLSELHAKMKLLTAAGTSADYNTLFQVHRTLQSARAGLAILDGRISVSTMRRFFEQGGEFETRSLKHIVRYYLSKPAKDDNDRDKIDLLITRFCSITTPSSNNLKMRQVADNLEEMLEDLSRNRRGSELESVQSATIARLRQFARAILEARSFNSLIEGKLILHLRQFKIELGDAFYAPMVLAEIVKVNVAIHNKFQELYYSEQARLRMETARMLRSLQTTSEHKKVETPSHPMLAQLNSLTVQMQHLLQELKRDLTDQLLQDRVARASIEADGSSINQLIGSLEESLKRSRDLLKRVQDVYLSSPNKEAQK